MADSADDIKKRTTHLADAIICGIDKDVQAYLAQGEIDYTQINNFASAGPGTVLEYTLKHSKLKPETQRQIIEHLPPSEIAKLSREELAKYADDAIILKKANADQRAQLLVQAIHDKKDISLIVQNSSPADFNSLGYMKGDDGVDYAFTPLGYAATKGDEASFDKLVAAGADVNAPDDAGDTPLINAARTGNLSIIKKLVANDKIKIDAENQLSKSALFAAIEEGQTATVDYLIDKGAKTTSANGKLNAYDFAGDQARALKSQEEKAGTDADKEELNKQASQFMELAQHIKDRLAPKVAQLNPPPALAPEPKAETPSTPETSTTPSAEAPPPPPVVAENPGTGTPANERGVENETPYNGQQGGAPRYNRAGAQQNPNAAVGVGAEGPATDAVRKFLHDNGERVAPRGSLFTEHELRSAEKYGIVERQDDGYLRASLANLNGQHEAPIHSANVFRRHDVQLGGGIQHISTDQAKNAELMRILHKADGIKSLNLGFINPADNIVRKKEFDHLLRDNPQYAETLARAGIDTKHDLDLRPAAPAAIDAGHASRQRAKAQE